MSADPYFSRMLGPMVAHMPWLKKIPWIAAALASHAPAPMPIVGVYVWRLPTPEILQSPLWRLPFVVPHIECFWSFGPDDRRTPKERAAYIFGVVTYYRDNLPGFDRWSMFAHRSCESFRGGVGNLFVSAEAHHTHNAAILAELAPMLERAGIAPPLYLDPDYEVEPSINLTTEPGRTCIRHATMDAALGAALYLPARKVWPQTLCGNWATFGSTDEHRVHNWRPRESPVGLGPQLRCDIQMAPVYGNTIRDTLDMPSGEGWDTFTDQLTRYKVNPADFGGDNDAIARAIHLGKCKDFIAGMNGAKPGTAGLCLTWVGDGVWMGKETYSDPRFFPAWYRGAALDYNAHPELVRAIFDEARVGKVKVVNIFAQDATRDGLDKMAKVLQAAAE